MKKFIASCLVAAAGCGLFLYASDHLSLYQGGELVKMFKVEEIDKITYAKDQETSPDFSTMKLSFKDDTSTEITIRDIDALVYDQSRGTSNVGLVIIPHYESAQLDIYPEFEDTYYRISGIPVAELEAYGFDESIWAELLMDNDIAYIHSVADYYGQPLSYFSPDDIFEKGTQLRDWFPSTMITPGTPIALVLYTCKLEGDEVVPTCDPVLYRFTTKELVIEDIDYNITADLKSNRITVKADAPEGYEEHPSHVTLFPDWKVEQSGLDELVALAAADLENLVYNSYGESKTWDEVTFKGHGENTFTNLCEGDVYYGVAFGCDYGIVDSNPKYAVFTVPEPEVTDDCTFDVVATQKTPAVFELNIKPSNPDTRYAAMLVNKADVTETNTISKIIGKHIQYLNNTNTIKWDETDLLYNGDVTINTYDNTLNAKYLNIGEEYYVLIFGLDELQTRTTAVKAVDIVPTSQAADDLSFEIIPGEFDTSSSWTRYLTVTVKPSDPEAKYVFEYLPADNASADLSQTDEEFISNYVGLQGQYLTLRQGEVTRKMSIGQNWSTGAFKDYILFVFGYDGETTSPLYMYRVSGETGEMEQLRGPQPQETLSFGVNFGEFDASSQWSHYQTITVTPSDPEAKYVFEYLPTDNAYADLSQTDEEFISNYVSVQGQYLTLRQGEVTRKMSISQNWSTGDFKDYIVFIFGYDGEATTPLYMYRVCGNDGTVEQLRGPGAE